MKRSGARQEGESASQLISKRIAELGDWRGETLGRIRALIKEADPDILEEWKWMGTPVWSHDGIVCTGETYKKVVKMTFAKGASLKDPSRLFNSSLDGKVRRAIDIHEGEKIDAPALKALIRAAVALNVSGKKAAPLYIQYTGLLELNEAVQGALASNAGTDFGKQYFFTNPRLETGDERYAWVNTTFFIGEGRLLPGLGVEYRVWRPA